MDIKNLIHEIGGLVLHNPQPQFRAPRLPISIPSIHGVELQQQPSFTKRLNSRQDLDPWQQHLYDMVINRQDVLVNVNPAGGKTKPVVFAWQDSFADRPDFDKILWITPTIQLANQVFHVDLKEALLDRIKKWTNDPSTKFPTHLLPPQIQHLAANYQNANQVHLTHEDVNALNTWLMGTAMVLRAGPASSGGGIGDITPNTIAAVCTYSYAPNILEKQRPKIIVIDELQQFVPIEAQGDNDKQAKDFLNILRLLPKSSILVLLTGSMNGETSEQIIQFINKHFGRNLKLFHVGNDLASNRASIVIEPHTKMKTPQDRIDIIKQCIRTHDAGNAMIMFSSKNTETEFLLKNAIFPIAKRLTMELPQRSIEQVCGVSPGDDFKTDRMPFALNYNAVDPGQIDHMSLSDATARIKGDPEDPRYMASYLKYMLSQNVPTERPLPGHDMPALPDPFLAKCILCGFGYLANSSIKNFRMHNQDIMLVQNLFKQGKIYFLLATDMIGVGTTLTIRKLYLPDLNKFKGPTLPYGQIDPSSLVQLINRVGRQPQVAATIYCNPKDYTTINTLLRSDPMSEVTPALFGHNTSAIEQNLSLIDRVRMVLNTIRGNE